MDQLPHLFHPFRLVQSHQVDLFPRKTKKGKILNHSHLIHFPRVNLPIGPAEPTTPSFPFNPLSPSFPLTPGSPVSPVCVIENKQ